MDLKLALVVLTASVGLLVYICVSYVLYPVPHGIVYWNDDTAAAQAPFVYRFSSYNQYFPGLTLSEVKMDCLPCGAATVRAGGRLGNLIMEFLTLWTAARLHNLTAFVPSKLRDRLKEVFEPLGVLETYELLWTSGCPTNLWEMANHCVTVVDLKTKPLAEALSAAKEAHVPIIFEECVILPETIIPLAAEVRRHFRYRLELREYAENKLEKLRRSVRKTSPEAEELVFAGVHVRRTDYAEHLLLLYNSRRPADEHYYGKAALWLKSTVVPPGGELVLVVASDDPDWVQRVLLPHLKSLGLRHSYLLGDSMLDKPERDLALLSACNHSVIAYGTFGLSSALMAGGRTAVYHLQQGDAVSPAMQFAQHMPGWVAILREDSKMAALMDGRDATTTAI